ncbi:MAG: undecaprenyldiphospho-muramoylpentapeptide beta-N-acetylglucosaminyltransferase [Firmicutes bacterium]|nr:undecaprenyldiphospho-muramoylpentapeptide beta-N-acetylglucosaminyltransferase [Bacillota bacterium]
MRVIVSAGGTGGHIYPALALINKIKQEEPNSEFLYIGTTDRMEHKIIPEKNIPYLGIEISGLNRKNPFKNIKVLKKYFNSLKTIEQKMKEFKPDIVLGIGGYVTAPVIYTAKKLGYKTFIHEQNSIPGLSNKFLSKHTDKIGVSLPESVKYFPKNKVFFSGNPRSEEIMAVKPVNKKELGLKEDKKLVIIVMGSQGSTTMNKKLKESLSSLKNKPYEVIFVTGKGYYDNYKDTKVSSNVKIVPYLDNMLSVLKKTDLIVSRAGASTIAEITAIGLPSILIPSPFVTHNHQLKNALALEEKNATVIIEEKDFTEEKLVNTIDNILNDEVKYKQLKENTYALGIRDSASRIYREIKTLIDGE